LRLLLDTHALLALLSSDYPLSSQAEEAMEKANTQLLVSVVSVWEIAIKRAIGKLEAPEDLLARIDETETEMLTITASHANATGELPLHHSDPFDRLLIAQAKLEGCAILTRDRAFGAYGVPVVW
jgi:PIN domain nuclease of toxin-antitoxin system